jgi:hypothetical protein
MPYQFRDRARVEEPESALSSTASSTTPEHKSAADKILLTEGPESNHLKRDLSILTGGEAREFHSLSIGNIN